MERRRSIFDSQSERRVFHELKSTWGSDYYISAPVPVRNVLGWEQIKALDLPDKDTRYLLSADFDFVVCTKNDGVPLIAVEFDGFTRGYSRNAQHVSTLADEERRHKFNAKLQACEFYGMPMVIVSNEEAFWGDSDMFTALDALVGSVISSMRTTEDVHAHGEELANALEEDPSGDGAGGIINEIRFANELRHNPVVRRIAEMEKQIGYSGEGVQPIRDRDHLGYVGGRFAIFGGMEMSNGKCRVFEYMTVTLYLRAVNCLGCSEFNMIYDLGHYLLLTKAIKRFGATEEEFWRNAQPHGKWVAR